MLAEARVVDHQPLSPGLVPDPEQREEVLQTAAKIMDAPQYLAVHKALRLRMQHTDRLSRDQIAEIAAKALGVPVDVLLASVR